ncbi:MAG TPA: hypothetical protein PKA64_02240 [Myxococcota bacterium]|nr:hypothetical protein [Myxococcota bacterium]
MRASVGGAALIVLGLVGCGGHPSLSLPLGDDTDAVPDTDPGDTPDDTTPPVRIQPGDLVITEFLLDSRVCDGVAGQVIELFNTTSGTIDLQNLSIGNGLTTARISSGTIRADAYAIGVPASSADCHGIGANFTYGDIELSSTRGGAVELWDHDRLLDVVDIAGWDNEPGVSWSLDPDHEDAVENDDLTRWCLGEGRVGATVDSGSPGRAGEACPLGSQGGEVVPLGLADLDPGDLVITELMLRPETCGAAVGQYIELYNASDRRVVLDGLLISDGAGFASLDRTLQMPVDSYAYLGAGDFSTHCYLGGVLPNATWGSQLVIQVGEELSVGGGTPYEVLDAVATAELDPDRGVAKELSGDHQDAASNDLPAQWCNATVPITGSFDRGTPGVRNVTCAAVGAGTPVLGSELLPGDLIITEAMFDPDSCPDYDAQYFEVYNASGLLLNLRGLTMVINGRSVTLQGDYLIDADVYAIAELYSGASPAGCYVGLTHDFLFDTGRMPNWGTEIRLQGNFGLIDAVDLTRQATIAGAALQLDPDALSAAANDDVSQWCHATQPFTGSLGDLGSPKEANEQCPAAPEERDSADTGPEPEPPPAPVSITTLHAGDLIITEFMPNPEDCSDFSAEYVELYNNTDTPVNLDHLVVTVGGSVGTVTQVNAPLAARSYGTLRYTTGAAPGCYGFSGNAWYDASKMLDTGTTLRVSNGAVTLDEVFASGWPAIQPGHAMTLDPDSLDAALNDGPDLWCSATSTFPGGFIDRGSPGAANADCPAGPGGPTTDTDTVDTDGPVAVPLIQASALVAGDLVITEIMANPEDCSDFAAEYVEIYNNTGSRVDLSGLEVMIAGTTRAVTRVFDPIEPYAYGTLRYTTGAAPACYGFDANAWYSSAKMADTGSNVRVSNARGTIDEVLAAGWSGFGPGAALQLDPLLVGATTNDDPDAWCPAPDGFPGSLGDRGSPGAENARCTVTDTSPFPDTFVPAETGLLDAATAGSPVDPLIDLWTALFDWWAP